MNTKLIKVENMLVRNGVVMPDDGGDGYVIDTAVQCPDGTLLPPDTNEFDVVRHMNLNCYGLAVMTMVKLAGPVKTVRVYWADGLVDQTPIPLLDFINRI